MLMRRCLFLFAFMMTIQVFGAPVRELKDVKDAIILTKSEEIIVIGLFEAKASAERAVFKKVAALFENSGIAFAISTKPDVIERYEVDELPASVLLQNFDAETGRRKRGRKPSVKFSGEFNIESLQRFITVEALPPVVAYPSTNGVDESSRYSMALHNLLLPVLAVFSHNALEAEALRKDLLPLGRALRGEAILVQVDIGALQPEAAQSLLKSTIGLSVSELRADRSAAAILDQSRGQALPFRGAVSAAGGGLEEGASDALRGMIEDYIANRPATLSKKGKSASGDSEYDPDKAKKKKKKNKGKKGGNKSSRDEL